MFENISMSRKPRVTYNKMKIIDVLRYKVFMNYISLMLYDRVIGEQVCSIFFILKRSP